MRIAILGSGIQVLLPMVTKDFLPVDSVSTALSWSSIGQGIITGVAVALLFALLPLLRVRHISPLRTLRVQVDDDVTYRDPLRWLVYFLIGLFVIGFAAVQSRSIMSALAFSVGILVVLLVLLGMEKWLKKQKH
jgi:putative ABC transport system permease protein